MWKWTDNENIKAVILDVDSLTADQIDYPFVDNIPNIIVFEVSCYYNEPRENHIFINYFDFIELLHEIMDDYSLNSSEIVAISSDNIFLKEMMKNHIGTVFVGDMEKTYLKHTPDYTNKDLNKIFTTRNYGYGAEVMATNNPLISKRVLLKCDSTISLSNGETKNIDLYFGGRYYPHYREYILDDPLTTVILDFKKQYNKIVDEYYDNALYHLSKKYTIDILTYVPMKPNDIITGRFDRFQSLHLNKMNEMNIHLKNIIKCTKDFSQKQYAAYHRTEIVKNAYELTDDVYNKNVVIIDDIFATGSTISEIARVLYEKGAKNVIAVFLAVNQMTESSYHYKRIKCRKCGSDMKLKISSTNELFFGCSNFPNCKETINKHVGLRYLSKINQISIDNILDLEDKY